MDELFVIFFRNFQQNSESSRFVSVMDFFTKIFYWEKFNMIETSGSVFKIVLTDLPVHCFE